MIFSAVLRIEGQPERACSLSVAPVMVPNPVTGFPEPGPLEWEIITRQWDGCLNLIGKFIPITVDVHHIIVRETFTGSAYVGSVLDGVVTLPGDGALNLQVNQQ